MKTGKKTNRPKVEVVKEFGAQPEKVFDAWLDPEMIGRWMVGSVVDEEVVSLGTDPRVGGSFSIVVRRDGDVLDHRGTYREIDRPNRLVFTWGVNEEAGDESVVTITIEPTEAGCRLRLVHQLDPKWEEYRERTEEGWTCMLDELYDVLNENSNNL